MFMVVKHCSFLLVVINFTKLKVQKRNLKKILKSFVFSTIRISSKYSKTASLNTQNEIHFYCFKIHAMFVQFVLQKKISQFT